MLLANVTLCSPAPRNASPFCRTKRSKSLSYSSSQMKPSVPLTRRQFVTRTALATAFTAAAPLTALAQATPRFKIIAFSKPFAELNFDDTADLVADIGWDGI